MSVETNIVPANTTNPYLSAYFKAKNLNPGDAWVSLEYMTWIEAKHDAFWRRFRTPSYVECSEKEQKLFMAFLEKMSAMERYNEKVTVIIPFDTLAGCCGYFFDCNRTEGYEDSPDVNNGYICSHPDADTVDGIGCCLTSCCPIAYPANREVCHKTGSDCSGCSEECCNCDGDMMVAEIPISKYDSRYMSSVPGENTYQLGFIVHVPSMGDAKAVADKLRQIRWPGGLDITWEDDEILCGIISANKEPSASKPLEEAIMDDALFELVIMDALKNTLSNAGFHFVLAEGAEIDTGVTLPEMREGYGQDALERDVSLALAGAESLSQAESSATAIRHVVLIAEKVLDHGTGEYGSHDAGLLEDIFAAESLSEKLPAEEGDAVKRMLTFAKKALFENHI